MQDIDNMDMIGFIRIRAWNARKKKSPKTKKAYIDQVWRSDL